MFCSLSGSIPIAPVVSRKSGLVFEKTLIEKHLISDDVCPITGDSLSTDDLIPVTTTQSVRPRPITATSIPGLLSHFQNEWDALMLETFSLKHQLDATRKELSQVLYQHDAACRVIARLTRERDNAYKALSVNQKQLKLAENENKPTPKSSTAYDGKNENVENEGVPQALIEALSKKALELSKGRKKRTNQVDQLMESNFEKMDVISNISPHLSREPNGVTCVDLHPSAPLMTVSGGMDTNGIVYDHQARKEFCTLRGHSRQVNAAKFHPDPSRQVLLTAGADNLVKIWTMRSAESKYVESATIGRSDEEVAFRGGVTGLSIHPLGDYMAFSSAAGSWSFADLSHGCVLETVRLGMKPSAYTSICFHPDGLLLGLGTKSPSNAIQIWDIKTRDKIHSFESSGGAVNAIDFSENGYFMASTGSDGEVRLWDLRKLKMLKTHSLPFNAEGSCVRFDHSGSVLAASGGKSVVITAVKEWAQIKTLDGHTQNISQLCFSSNAKAISTSSFDRTVKIWKCNNNN